ncbi:hypothetical protein [Bacillus toyonensis]|uniref:hypothetical protein n=1 Tax=Bacillus toyonensis TaxID=155322 RepID=UPI002E1FC8D5|nr:hypothetical protein [Bacillus toyonensis]
MMNSLVRTILKVIVDGKEVKVYYKKDDNSIKFLKARLADVKLSDKSEIHFKENADPSDNENEIHIVDTIYCQENQLRFK